jgi:hypothetical protein
MKAKKVLAAAVLAAVTLGIAAPAFAADPKFSGETRIRWTSDDNGGNDDSDYRLRFTFKDQINEQVGVKARFAIENDFGAGTAERADAKIDQISMNYNFADGKTTAIVGLDDVFVGNGLVMDGTFEALQLATKLGSIDASLFIGRDLSTDISGVSFQKTFDKATLGANYFTGEGEEDQWSVNASYNFGAVKVSGELADFDGDQAFMAGFAFNNFKVTAYEVEEWKPGWTTLDIPAGEIKGITLSADWAVAKNMTLTTEYQVNDTIDRARVQLVSKF